jgi:WD40 repeat protein
MFLDDTRLLSGSSDCSLKLTDIQQNMTIANVPFAHNAAINAIGIGPDLIATGDDDGELRLWDLRDCQTKICEFSDSSQQITGLHFYSNFLYSGDINGHMYKYDARMRKVVTAWELAEEATDFMIVDNMVLISGDNSDQYD